MSKNKDKNQYGTFLTGKALNKKNARVLITAAAAVIFVFGTGFILYKNKTAPKVKPSTAAVTSEIPGWWYQQYFGKSVCDTDNCKPEADPDLDKLTNSQEFYYHTNPLDAYTVKDTLNDGQLVAAGFDPSRSGRMTFNQVTAPDNILGESLLVQQDFQDIVNQSKDISTVPLSLVAASELKTTPLTDTNTYNNYAAQTKQAINKYFPESNGDDLKAVIKSANGANLDDVKTKASILADELKTITVPTKMLAYHQYMIAFFQLFPKVLLNQSDPSLSSDQWYQDAQSLFAVTQKLDLEQQRLNQQIQK